MADKIKKGDWSAQTTGILLIVGPILTILFNSLNPVNAANAFSFTFSRFGMVRLLGLFLFVFDLFQWY